MLRKALVTSVAALMLATSGMGSAEAASKKERRAAGVAVGVAAAAIGLAAVANANRPARHYYGGSYYCQDPRTGLYYRNCVQPQVVYQQPPVVYQQQPAVVYRQAPAYGAPQPWTPDWYSYCSSRYRSFNPQTGMFTSYSGRQQFCQ